MEDGGSMEDRWRSDGEWRVECHVQIRYLLTLSTRRVPGQEGRRVGYRR
jgi:hypothetical protein